MTSGIVRPASSTLVTVRWPPDLLARIDRTRLVEQRDRSLMIRVLVREALDAGQRLDGVLPAAAGTMVGTRFGPDLLRRVDTAAGLSGRDRTNTVRALVAAALDARATGP